jgi:putative ABC transport system substrate-binding protein
MRRREFVTLLGGAAAVWPLGARAQQTIPAVLLAYNATLSETTAFVAAFQRGLVEAGFIEGQNVAVEYRDAGSQYEQLPALVAEFVNRQTAVIVGTSPVALAAKKATSTIPIVFLTGSDPVKLGLVASFNRPGGNATGVTILSAATETKRLGLLRELLPKAKIIAVLADPNFLATVPRAQPELQKPAACASIRGCGLPGSGQRRKAS